MGPVYFYICLDLAPPSTSVCHISVICISVYLSLSLPLSFISAISLAPSSYVALSLASLSLIHLSLLYLVSSTPSSLFVSILYVYHLFLWLLSLLDLCLYHPCIFIFSISVSVFVTVVWPPVTPDREPMLDHSEDSAKVQCGDSGVLLGFLTGLWVRGY